MGSSTSTTTIRRKEKMNPVDDSTHRIEGRKQREERRERREERRENESSG